MNRRISYIKDCADSIFIMAHKNNINEPYNLLELFAGKGSIFTQYLASRCENVTGWEIENNFSEEFKKNVPNGNFICKDTIKAFEFDIIDIPNNINIISVDNPLGKYGSGYFEHFRFIKDINKLIDKKSILAIDVIKKPYNAENNIEWIEERKKFYKIDSDELDMDYALKFYKDILEKQGIHVIDGRVVCRELDGDLDYFYMLIFAVDKI